MSDISELLANGVKPPLSPMASMGQVMSLRNMMQENAMNAEKLVGERLANKQNQLAADRDQQFRDLVQQRMQAPPAAAPGSDAGIPGSGPAGITPPALAPGTGRASKPMTMPGMDYESLAQAADAAGLPDRAAQLREQGAKIAETRSVATKNVAEGTHFDAQTAKMHAEAVGQATGSLVNLPDDQAAALWPTVRHGLIAQGHLSPQDAAAVPEQYPGKPVLQQMHDAVMDATQQVTTHIATLKQQDESAAAQAALPATVAKSQMETAVAYAQAHPEDADAQQKALTAQQRFEFADKAATRAQTAARDAQTAANEKTRNAIAQGELGVAKGRLAVEQSRYSFDANGGISPAAQMAVDGKMDPRTLRLMLRSNPGMITQLRTADPNFDEANIEKRFDTLKEFNNTSIGKAGGQALALNTLIHHADLYQQAGEALKNGVFKPGNAAYNAIASMWGSAPPQSAALVAQFLAGETGKVATGGVPAEGEVNKILKSLGSDSSPEQIQDAGNKMLEIASGRAIPLVERVKDARLENVVHVLGPDAQEILKKRGFDPNTMKKAGAAGGSTSSGDTSHWWNPATNKVEPISTKPKQ
jgi:hypothetical protein